MWIIIPSIYSKPGLFLNTFMSMAIITSAKIFINLQYSTRISSFVCTTQQVALGKIFTRDSRVKSTSRMSER